MRDKLENLFFPIILFSLATGMSLLFLGVTNFIYFRKELRAYGSEKYLNLLFTTLMVEYLFLHALRFPKIIFGSWFGATDTFGNVIENFAHDVDFDHNF